MPVPQFKANNWNRDAVSWSKDDAAGIDYIWHLVVLLREHGLAERLLRSRNPGKLLYEDDYQVVVREWKKL